MLGEVRLGAGPSGGGGGGGRPHQGHGKGWESREGLSRVQKNHRGTVRGTDWRAGQGFRPARTLLGQCRQDGPAQRRVSSSREIQEGGSTAVEGGLEGEKHRLPHTWPQQWWKGYPRDRVCRV